MQRDIGDPDIVLNINGEHVGHEEGIGTPSIQNLPTILVQRQNGIRRDWSVPITSVDVVPNKNEYIRMF